MYDFCQPCLTLKKMYQYKRLEIKNNYDKNLYELRTILGYL